MTPVLVLAGGEQRAAAEVSAVARRVGGTIAVLRSRPGGWSLHVDRPPGTRGHVANVGAGPPAASRALFGGLGEAVAAALAQEPDRILLAIPVPGGLRGTLETLAAHRELEPITVGTVVDPSEVESALTVVGPLASGVGDWSALGGSAADGLVQRIELADVLVLPGHEALPYETARGRALVRLMAPGAMLVYGDLEAVGSDALWQARRQPLALRWQDWGSDERLVRVTASGTGAQSVHFQARRPVHPGRLHDEIERSLEGVLRSRGIAWLATRPGVAWRWDQVGPVFRLTPSGTWLADRPDAWGRLPNAIREQVTKMWHPYYGDRAQLIEAIGADFDPDRVVAGLDRCLMTDDELARGFARWPHLPDPFAHLDAPENLDLVHLGVA